MAEILFAGPIASVEADRSDCGEVREVAFGLINDQFFVCVYADRDDERQVISLREATRGEMRRVAKTLNKTAHDALAATDWRKIDAMTDEDIARQIGGNPDAAPDMAPEIDVRAIRRAAGMTQSQFAAAYEFSVRTVQE